MTITIDVAPEREPYLRRQAELSGLTLDQFARRALDEAADAQAAREMAGEPTERPTDGIRHDRTGAVETRAERIAHFREWAYGHDRDTPLLTDEEISRHAMYARDNETTLGMTTGEPS